MGGRISTGGVSTTGGAGVTGGLTATGGRSASGGDIASGGATPAGGASSSGGTTRTGGTAATGGVTASGGIGTGGNPNTGGTSATGGADAGSVDTRGAVDAAADTTATGFDPCPTNGDPCKVLPLGDSITLGTNYPGGYRIKLFTHTVTDQKNITFVGYDTANPPDSTSLSKLGAASSKFVPKHEGHFAWTIQQVDDLITGVSTGSQDGVNYTGKKIVADAKPNIVLVHLGTNDMQQQPSGATDRLGKLIDHVVTDAPNAVVVVASIIPLPQYASNVTSFNQAIPGIVKQRADAGKHVVYVDQFAGFSGKTGLMDSVHPYEAGYEQMSVVWYATIKAYLH
jgi:hypothetical protein